MADEAAGHISQANRCTRSLAMVCPEARATAAGSRATWLRQCAPMSLGCGRRRLLRVLVQAAVAEEAAEGHQAGPDADVDES
jgi:hypothetical protein